MFTIPGIRVHDALEWMFTFGWNLRSRCPGIRTQWRKSQLDRLYEDAVDEVIEGLRFLKKRHRSKDEEIDKLTGYLERNGHRMKYRTFRQSGYYIGSGAVESAVSHVMQQRMKRVGMRWHAAGADAMLALRCVFRSTGAWDSFWNYRKQVA